MRQNWGTSTITLKQEMLLPEGEYTLDADVWKSGLGGDAYVRAITQDGPQQQAPSLENKEAWQHVSLSFHSDGKASTTISLSAMHNYNGTEKIIGFDNVVITGNATTGIDSPRIAPATSDNHAVFDLQGRPLNHVSRKGIYISGEKKRLVR